MDQVLRRACLVLVVVLALAAPAWGAFAFVGGTSTETVSLGTITLSRSVTANNLLIVGTAVDGLLTITISDGVNTWTQIGATRDDTVNNERGLWWYAVAASTTTITVTLSGYPSPVDNFSGAFLAEWSGNATASPLDGNTGQVVTTGTTAPNGETSGVFSTTTDGDLIVGFIIDSGAVHPGVNQFNAGTVSEAFVERATASSDPAVINIAFAVEDAVQTTASASTQAAWTAVAADAWIGFAAAFKALAGAGGYILTEAGDCLNAENADRLITEDVSAGVGPCTAASPSPPQRTLIGVGT